MISGREPTPACSHEAREGPDLGVADSGAARPARCCAVAPIVANQPDDVEIQQVEGRVEVEILVIGVRIGLPVGLGKLVAGRIQCADQGCKREVMIGGIRVCYKAENAVDDDEDFSHFVSPTRAQEAAIGAARSTSEDEITLREKWAFLSDQKFKMLPSKDSIYLAS